MRAQDFLLHFAQCLSFNPSLNKQNSESCEAKWERDLKIIGVFPLGLR